MVGIANKAGQTSTMRDDVLSSLNVSRETSQRLDSYVHLLLTWQKSINLIAPSTVDQVWRRHIQDCGQIATLFPDAERWLDLGSGAGLPGIVVAILRSAAQPRFQMQLIESNGKKASFLREVSRLCALPVRVHHGRIEAEMTKSVQFPVDVVTARALASLDLLLDFARPAFQRGAKAVFMKGEEAETELTMCRKRWHIEAELIPSVTEPKARLVVVHQARLASD